MDYLWTPWRYRYIADAGKDSGCIFCDAVAANDDKKTQIVFRGATCFVILNRYPYTSGHVMVVPYAHVADLAAANPEMLAEMMRIAQRVQVALKQTYHPDGFNLGMNLGRAAGAGVTGHLHLHVLPRWSGDANFMTVVSETRVEPEDLSTTYEKLRKALNG
ncbi:MAG TPA: HIT domain-containing protein [Candidatus Dormibacteraeota bacterium]|jgi:ATP adenylyltransferase|nr:HIT domain-containing protein [Candidatus Dormibacteraeota bacterium]